MNNDLKTTLIKDKIYVCEDLEDLKEYIFPLLYSQQEQWAEKVNSILEDNKFTKTKFAKACGVSRVSLDKWCKGSIPKNRETFLRIGMAAGLDVKGMNQLLQRYGRYPGLYSKSLEDCICMFVINKGYGNEANEKYQYILDKIKSQIIRSDDVIENLTTVRFDSQVSKIDDEVELERFISQNIAVFANAYHKFYAYVKIYISENYIEPAYANNANDMAIQQGWTSSLKQCVYAIIGNKWYPTRNKIISLGLHLSMDHEQIDEMLELAHMEPLCAKNIFESVIMFILEDASLNDILDKSNKDYDPDDLCHYAREVLNNLDLPESADFIKELQIPED